MRKIFLTENQYFRAKNQHTMANSRSGYVIRYLTVWRKQRSMVYLHSDLKSENRTEEKQAEFTAK